MSGLIVLRRVVLKSVEYGRGIPSFSSRVGESKESAESRMSYQGVLRVERRYREKEWDDADAGRGQAAENAWQDSEPSI
jgi:hypothetical protein